MFVQMNANDQSKIEAL